MHDDVTITSCDVIMGHFYCAADVSHVGQVAWYSGWVSPSVCNAWRASARVASWRVRPFPMFDFDAVFNSGFVSSSSTRWYD